MEKSLLRSIVPAGCAVLIATTLGAAPAERRDRADRRNRQEPGLILETGARTGACDVLTFTPDGKYLLAAGDDKVARTWKVTAAGLQPDQVLRWSIGRESRGGVYALALSPDREGRRVAMAGNAMSVGCGVAVVDRRTGQVLNALHSDKFNGTIWALAFSPSGEQLAFGTQYGGVYVWDLEHEAKEVGTHRPQDGGDDFVHFVTFRSERELISVAQDGRALQWDLDRPGRSRELFRFERVANLRRVALSANRKWIAAVGEGKVTQHTAPGWVEVRSFPDGREERGPVTVPEGGLPYSLAFDAGGERLAVGVRFTDPNASFYKDIAFRALIYDLTGREPRETRGPTASYIPWALAFHPDGVHFAMAGGNDQEVTLWKLPNVQRPVSTIRSPGGSIWGVALAADKERLGFRDHRAANPDSPNHRGSGPWRVFDLQTRKWVPAANFQPVEPLARYGGWEVRPSRTEGDEVGNAAVWYVVGPRGQRAALPWSERYGLPRCYTFLKPSDGKPLRLAVGHAWGISLFEITPQTDADHPPRRVRLFTGHDGEVMALAPSADQKVLVSGSLDQTIAAWSLADWPSQPELGAGFHLQGGKLLVGSVDAGSPAWEAKLTPGDEVLVFAFYKRKLLYDPGHRIPEAKRSQYKLLDAEQARERLLHPVPGEEFYFQLRTPGGQPLEVLTTVRQRPLWRFFPTRDGEWVLWRWRDYYYDTSTFGDSYVGWQVNGELKETPVFYPAEKFRAEFHRPDKVADVVRAWAVKPERVIFPDIEPPGVSIRASATSVKDQGVKVDLAALRRGDGPGQKLDRVNLWVNDYLFRTWEPKDGDFREVGLEVPPTKLRRGPNALIFQCSNQKGGLAEDRVTVNYSSSKALAVRLYGLTVGINDYHSVTNLRAPRGQTLNLNFARADAVAMKEVWREQAGTPLYDTANVQLLIDRAATPEAILGQIRVLGKAAGPDDWLVLFMAGHGVPVSDKPGSFAFVCSDTDGNRLAETGVTGEALQQELSKLVCHKLVLLDSCHSGAVALNPVRALTRDGVGPTIILTACRPDEESGEDPGLKHGLFTLALLEALGSRFTRADSNGDGRLDAVELAAYLQARVPELAEDDTQHPVYFPIRVEPLQLIYKK